VLCLPKIKENNAKLIKPINLNKSHDASEISKIIKKTTTLKSKPRTASGLYKSYTVHNTSISPEKKNDNLKVSRENEISIIKPSNDYKIVINSDDKFTLHHKPSNKNLKLIIPQSRTNSFESTAQHADSTGKKRSILTFDNNESIPSLTGAQPNLKNLLSEESIIKPESDGDNIESIEDLHISFVKILRKSKKIVYKQEGVIHCDILNTVVHFDELDI
jgi:hypothetical protein